MAAEPTHPIHTHTSCHESVHLPGGSAGYSPALYHTRSAAAYIRHKTDTIRQRSPPLLPITSPPCPLRLCSFTHKTLFSPSLSVSLSLVTPVDFFPSILVNSSNTHRLLPTYALLLLYIFEYIRTCVRALDVIITFVIETRT